MTATARRASASGGQPRSSQTRSWMQDLKEERAVYCEKSYQICHPMKSIQPNPTFHPLQLNLDSPQQPKRLMKLFFLAGCTLAGWQELTELQEHPVRGIRALGPA